MIIGTSSERKRAIVFTLGVVLAVSLVLYTARKVRAAGPTFTTIDFPGAVATLGTDINDSGQIVGEYTFSGLSDRQGFLLSNGIFTSISFPGAPFTRAIGINRYGDIVGDYILKGGVTSNQNNNDHGYLLRGGVFTSIEFPNASGTIATGINANGDIVGYYADSKGTHGFLLRGGGFSSIDFPGADAFTQAWKINDRGEIVGRYEGANGSKYHLFLFSNGVFTSVPDVPEGVQTAPGDFSEDGGLSATGSIVSHYCSSTPCLNLSKSVGDLHGFLLDGGVYTTIDFPAAIETLGFGVNSSNDVVGGYEDTSGRFHAYLRTP